MQWYSGPEGDQRIWYEADDIELIANEQLQKAGLKPTLSNPITDLERFIEGHLRVELDLYADLPTDVLGMTEFPIRMAPRIRINSSLTELADANESHAAIGRWRATLAHEASHVYLHRYLFDPELAPMRRQEATPRAGVQDVQCLHRDISSSAVDVTASRHSTDWREVQANRGMAALLMPRRTFTRLALQRMNADAYASPVVAGSPEFDALTATMSTTFQVSRQAAGIRLQTLRLAV